MAGSTLYPPYVSTLGYGEQCSPAPGVISDARLAVFGLRVVDKAALQATCDHFLNAPSGGAVTYSVLGDVVFVSFMHADRLTSGAEEIGWQPDDEAAFWVPLVARGPTGTLDRLVFWMPYVVISVPEGMVTGREIWGFFKAVGQTLSPAPDAPSLKFQTSAVVYDPMAATTRGQIEPLITIEGPGQPGGPASVWTDIAEAARAFNDAWTGGAGGFPFGDAGLIWTTLEHMIEGEVFLVNLKQFRDAADSSRACYQALIEGACQITRLKGGGFLPGGFTATIPNWASHRIAQNLGLPTEGSFPVEFGVWVEQDFTALDGREVWKAPGGSEPPPPGCLNLPALIRRWFSGSR